MFTVEKITVSLYTTIYGLCDVVAYVHILALNPSVILYMLCVHYVPPSIPVLSFYAIPIFPPLDF